MTGESTGFRVAGDAYDRYVGRYSRELGERVRDVAGIAPGMRAVDVGCGPGGLTAVLAERLGAESVAAVDPSEPFVAACRDRVPGADVRLGSAESLPFADGSFDAVLSQLVVNFLADAPAALSEMQRVARPRAIVAGAVWDYAGEMTLLRAFWDAAADALGYAAVAQDEGRIMAYCTVESLGGLWTRAGLEDVSVQPLVVTAAYDGFDDLWEPFTAGVGPAGAFTAALPAADQDRVRETFRSRLGSPDGPFELTARAWCATGRR